MQPPTKAHLMLLDKVVNTAKEMDGDPILFLTHTQDKRKNPLPWEMKVQYVKAAVGPQINVCEDDGVKTAFDFMVWVGDHQYKKVIIIVGGDRVEEFKTFFEKYNGQETPRGKYEFEDIKVVSAGARDPDGTGVSSYSATKARNAALDGDFETFKQIAGVNSEKLASDMFNTLRKFMGLGENVINTTSLSINKRELTHFFKDLPESVTWDILEGVEWPDDEDEDADPESDLQADIDRTNAHKRGELLDDEFDDLSIIEEAEEDLHEEAKKFLQETEKILSSYKPIEEGLFDLTLKDLCPDCGHPLLWHSENEYGKSACPSDETAIKNWTRVEKMRAERAAGINYHTFSQLESSAPSKELNRLVYDIGQDENLKEEYSEDFVQCDNCEKIFDAELVEPEDFEDYDYDENPILRTVIRCPYCGSLNFTDRLNRVVEAANRTVKLISFKFPSELIGFSDIHSTSQYSPVLTGFGRGVIGPNGEIKIGPAGSSHRDLSKSLGDTKRFYRGYSREPEIVYVVSKNAMDTEVLKNKKLLMVILSNVFDFMKLSIAPGGLKLQN